MYVYLHIIYVWYILMYIYIYVEICRVYSISCMYVCIHILEICIFINQNVYVCITSAWSTFRAAGGTTRWLLVPGLTYAEIHIPGTLKSTANLPLKMNGWKTNYFRFGAIGVFSGANMLVSGSVKKKSTWKSANSFPDFLFKIHFFIP